MKTRITLLTGMLAAFLLAVLSPNSFCGGKPADQMRKARRLCAEKRYEDAIALYQKMAGETDDPAAQMKWIGEAIKIVIGRLKDPERAMKMTEEIKDSARAKFARLALMVSNGQWTRKDQAVKAIERFKDVDVTAWPADCRMKGFATRGAAFYCAGRYDEAEKDLLAALECPGGDKSTKGNSCLILGQIYRDQIKDADKALAAFRRGMAVTPAHYSWRDACFFNALRLLVKQGKLDEAEAMFKDVGITRMRNDQKKAQFYLAYADVLAKQDKNGQAATQLSHVIRLGGASEGVRKRAREKLDELIGEMK